MRPSPSSLGEGCARDSLPRHADHADCATSGATCGAALLRAVPSPVPSAPLPRHRPVGDAGQRSILDLETRAQGGLAGVLRVGRRVARLPDDVGGGPGRDRRWAGRAGRPARAMAVRRQGITGVAHGRAYRPARPPSRRVAEGLHRVDQPVRPPLSPGVAPSDGRCVERNHEAASVPPVGSHAPGGCSAAGRNGPSGVSTRPISRATTTGRRDGQARWPPSGPERPASAQVSWRPGGTRCSALASGPGTLSNLICWRFDDRLLRETGRPRDHCDPRRPALRR